MYNVVTDAKVLIVVVGESDIENDHVEGDNGKVIMVKVIANSCILCTCFKFRTSWLLIVWV